MAAGRYSTTLLKGVTGSGKTEVYLEAVAEALRRGRQALVLLPEIALSVEFLDRVEARFGARPAEWHSGVTQAARRRAWLAVATGDARLVVGARSALFLPFAELGLVVVDEEHDGSYKQEDGACYHARDMAVLRASIEGAAVVLASATPSLESWANAEAGKYARLDLPERFGVAELPEMRAIDLRADPPEPGRWISGAARRRRLPAPRRRRAGAAVPQPPRLRAADHLPRLRPPGRLRRTATRGWSSTASASGWSATSAARPTPIPVACPACKVEGRMTALGPGVERLAEEAAALWPDARLAILSSDLADGPRALKARIEEIAQGGADLVIGTQLVSKGHNFPLLTLVGVIDADLGLQGGDLRAAEKTFQLIRQVAGRAGRAERPGLALVQTHQPEHPAIRAILSGDDEGFWQRRGRGPPPGADAALRPPRRGRGQRHRRAADLGGRPRAGPRRRAAARPPAPSSSARRRRRSPASAAATACGCWCAPPKGVRAAAGAAAPGSAAVPCPGTCGSRSTSTRRASRDCDAPIRPARAGSWPPPVITRTRWPTAKAGSVWITAMLWPLSSRTVHSIEFELAAARPACWPATTPAVPPTTVAMSWPVPRPTWLPSAAPATPPSTAPASWLPWPPCTTTLRALVTVPKLTVCAVIAWFALTTLPLCCGTQAASAAARARRRWLSGCNQHLDVFLSNGPNLASGNPAPRHSPAPRLQRREAESVAAVWAGGYASCDHGEKGWRRPVSSPAAPPRRHRTSRHNRRTAPTAVIHPAGQSRRGERGSETRDPTQPRGRRCPSRTRRSARSRASSTSPSTRAARRGSPGATAS